MPGSLERVPGYIAAISGWQVAVAIEWRSPLAAEALRAAHARLHRSQAEPELDDIVIVAHAPTSTRHHAGHAQALLRTLLPA